MCAQKVAACDRYAEHGEALLPRFLGTSRLIWAGSWPRSEDEDARRALGKWAGSPRRWGDLRRLISRASSSILLGRNARLTAIGAAGSGKSSQSQPDR